MSSVALFFTFGQSLKKWHDAGLLDREKLLYEKLLEIGTLEKVFWFTYGPDDTELAAKLKSQSKLHKNIEVVPLSLGFNSPLGKYLYSILLPILKKDILKRADIFKTNQASGSWTAVIAKKLYKKPLIFRTGYTWSRLKATQNISALRLWFIETVEKFAYKNADLTIVTTKSQAEYISEKYGSSPENIQVIPNYIDTKIFKPDQTAEKTHDRFIYIGRLSNEKNLLNLITACQICDVGLDLYGKGPLERELRKHADNITADVNFKGTVPNSQIPQLLNSYRYFILPSHAESMPKSLIEALACGLICVGTDVTGINEIITDGINGHLAKAADSESIVVAIRKAVSTDNTKIITAAVSFAQRNYSINAVVDSYIKLFPKLSSIR